MKSGAIFQRGEIVRLTSPYWDADRGLYTVEYVYRNGSIAVVSRANGRRFEVPARICRHVSDNGGITSQVAGPDLKGDQ